MTFFTEVMTAIMQGSGFAAIPTDWRQLVMIVVACVLLYLGIGKGFEPLLLVPIAFGMLLANLPLTGLFNEPVYDAVSHTGSVGFMWVVYQGVQYAIYPSIIFMGIGAMTDFGPLLANPMSLLLGAAAQLGIFTAFLLALALGFTPAEAAAIGVIGGADGPTAILTASKLAAALLPAIAIAAYSYMALIPLIQPAAHRLQGGEDHLPHRCDHLRDPAGARHRPPDRHAHAGQPVPGVRRVRPPVRHRPERPDEHRHHRPGPVRGLQGHL